jgi:hypothetical protein
MSHDAKQLAVQLRAGLIRVSFPVSESAAKELRQAVRDYAVALRRDGVTPERAVIEIKRLLGEVGLELTTRTKSTEAALTPRDLFCGAVVGWCIDGYYSQDGADGSPTRGGNASGHERG